MTNFLNLFWEKMRGVEEDPLASQVAPMGQGAQPVVAPMGVGGAPAAQPKGFMDFLPDDKDKREAVLLGALSASAGMLSGGGPSATPTNFGGILGQSIGTGVNAYSAVRKQDSEMVGSRAKMSAEQRAVTKAQADRQFAATHSSSNGAEPSEQDLAELEDYLMSQGEYAQAGEVRQHRLLKQETLTKAGMEQGPNGVVRPMAGYDETLSGQEQAKSGGRKAGEAPYENTSDLIELDRINKERAAASQPALSTEEFIKRQNAGKQTTVTVGDKSNTSKFYDQSDEDAAKRMSGYVLDGTKAKTFSSNISTFMAMSNDVETGKIADWKIAYGPYAEAAGIKIDGLDKLQAMDAIVQGMIPLMKAPGEGSQSDFDAKQKLKSLINLGNTPDGNVIVSTTLQAVQQNKIAASDLARRAQNREMSWQEAQKQIDNLPDPYAAHTAYMKDKDKPKDEKTNGPKVTPMGVGSEPSKPNELPKVNSNMSLAERDKVVPIGGIFIGPDGNKHRRTK